MKAAIGYLRVSTEQQAHEGVSIAAQEARIREYASDHGFELAAILRDEAVSGCVPFAARPGGCEAVRLLAARRAVAVIGWSLDRMFRNTTDALAQTSAWGRRGIALHLVDEGGRPVDCSSADGRFLLALRAALAERERAKVGERTRFALAHLKAQGRAYSPTPFGFTRKGDRLVPDAAEQATVAGMLVLRAAGHSLRAIAAALNAAGSPAKGGGTWHGSTVAKVIANRIHEQTHEQEGVAA